MKYNRIMLLAGLVLVAGACIPVQAIQDSPRRQAYLLRLQNLSNALEKGTSFDDLYKTGHEDLELLLSDDEYLRDDEIYNSVRNLHRLVQSYAVVRGQWYSKEYYRVRDILNDIGKKAKRLKEEAPAASTERYIHRPDVSAFSQALGRSMARSHVSPESSVEYEQQEVAGDGQADQQFIEELFTPLYNALMAKDLQAFNQQLDTVSDVAQAIAVEGGVYKEQVINWLIMLTQMVQRVAGSATDQQEWAMVRIRLESLLEHLLQ